MTSVLHRRDADTDDEAVSPAGGPEARRRWIGPSLRRRLLVAAATFGLLLWVLSAGLGGTSGAIFASVLSVLTAVGLLLLPGIRSWILSDQLTGDVPARHRSVFLTDLAQRSTRTPGREVFVAGVLVVFAVVVALGVGTIGEKAMTVLVGLVGLFAMIAMVKNRSLLFMFVLTSSFSLIWYKKFTPFLAESYAVAIYITTVNVVLLFAYLVWAAEGTMFRDLRAGLRKPVFMLPVAGIAITLLSAVNAVDQRLVWAEIVRYVGLTALFFYVGIRVRRREHVWALMLGWLVFLGVQVMVSMSQYFTGGFLGIELFALTPDPLEPASLEMIRPFGTQIHPVFLACVVGMTCLMVASFALHVRIGNLMRYALLGCIPLALIVTFASRSRGPLVALVPGIAVVLFFAVRRGLLGVRVLVVGGLIGLIGVTAFAPMVFGTANSFFTSGVGNVRDNWNARWQINEIAFRMIRDKPMVGIGINSFESQIPKYTYEENPFDFRPAHNLYLLLAAETGMLGLALLFVVGSVFALYAYRLTLYDDPFFQSIGIGALGVLVYLAGEEINSFSLKQDIPMAMFWAIFGLLVAADRMAREGAPEMPTVSWFGTDTSPRPKGHAASDPSDPSDSGAGTNRLDARSGPGT